MGFAERLRKGLDWSDFPGRVGFAAWDLYERQPVTWCAERPVHPASTIKVLVLIAALRTVHRGKFTLDESLELPELTDRAGGSGVLRDLSSVRRLSVGDLLTLMIALSDNAATNAIIDAVGFDAINSCARSLGCHSTRLQRHLMESGAPGEKATAALDQARMLDRLALGAALPADLTRYALNLLSRQQVRDRLPALLPEGAGCWNKPGELLALRHDVGLIGTNSAPRAVVAVLVDELSDPRSRTSYHGGPACEQIAEIGRLIYESLD